MSINHNHSRLDRNRSWHNLNFDCFAIIVMLLLIAFCFYGCSAAFWMRVVSGPGGVNIENTRCLGVTDFEGVGGKKVAIDIASKLKQTKLPSGASLSVKYISVPRKEANSSNVLRIFRSGKSHGKDKSRYKLRKRKHFWRSIPNFEKRAKKEAIQQYRQYGVDAVLTGKMMYNDVMDLYFEKAREIYIMRETWVKFYIVLIDARSGQIRGRAYDVWNRGLLHADAHIPRTKYSILEALIEDYVENEVLKNVQIANKLLQTIYDLLKDDFDSPEVMLEKARLGAVNASVAGILRGTNY